MENITDVNEEKERQQQRGRGRNMVGWLDGREGEVGSLNQAFNEHKL